MNTVYLLEHDLEAAAAVVLVPSLRQLGLAADEYADRLQAAANAQEGPGNEPQPSWTVSFLCPMALNCIRNG